MMIKSDKKRDTKNKNTKLYGTSNMKRKLESLSGIGK